jgi:hypothetical protein
MINFNQYGAKPGVARQAGLLQQQMESNPVQPYVPFSQQSGLTPQVAPQAQVLSRADRLRLFRRQYGENQFAQPQGGK